MGRPGNSETEPIGSVASGHERSKLYQNRLSPQNRIARLVWLIVWRLLYRPTPNFLHGWRRFLLRIFGARIGPGAHPYPGCRIWAPWNLIMGPDSCLGNDVDCYCVAPIELGEWAVVSQYSYLCSATHDYRAPDFPLMIAPIRIGAKAWVAAGAFIGPGVTIGEGAVCGARSVVLRDVPPWTVAAGNPAKPVKKREMTDKTHD
jgi:putative colanic acid biosynthesis acetyltransferase WcaF